MDIRTHKKDTPQITGRYISETIARHTGVPILLLLSGETYFPLLNTIDTNVLHRKVTVGMAHDYFSTNPSVNHFAQLTHTDFYVQALQRDCDFVDTRPQQGDTIELFCKRYEKYLRTWKKVHPEGVVLVLLGIEEDGRTAGIVPSPHDEPAFTSLFENEAQWVTSYSNKERDSRSEQITVTNTFLRSVVHEAIVYAAGVQKQRVLQKVTAIKNRLHRYPARVLHDMKSVTIFTDQVV